MRARLVHAAYVLVFDEERKTAAECDVAGGVLVEQRVEEHGAEWPDPALTVDERELAEPQRAFVDRELRAQRLDVLVRVDLDRGAALEAHAQPADDRAVAQHERLRRRDMALGAQRDRAW